MLKFNSEKIRNKYLDGDPNIPPRYLELLLLRCELLASNAAFEKEWNHLNTLRDASDNKSYFKAAKEFRSKWYIHHPSGEHDFKNLPSFYVRHLATLDEGDIQDGKLVIEVDLNGPIPKICADFESLISTWHREFNRRIDEGDFYLDQIDAFEKKADDSRLRGNIKRDFDDYHLYLNIWKARKSGKSWKEVTREFSLHSIDSARNHYNSAERLIQEGIPGLPPFPT